MKKKAENNKSKGNDILEYSNRIIATLREPFLVLDKNLQVISANRAFYTKFKVSEKETVGEPINVIGNRQWDIPKLLTLLKEILPDKKIIEDYEITHKFEQLGKRELLLNARQLHIPVKTDAEKEEELILLAIEDVTDRKLAQKALEKSEERYRRAFETSKDGLLLVHKTKGDILESNEAVQNKLGHSEKEFLEKKLWEIGVTENYKDFQEMMLELERDGIFNNNDTTVKTKEGTKVEADVFLVDRAEVAQCNIRDITKRKQAETYLEMGREILQVLNKPDKIEESIQSILSILKKRIGVDAVGLRLQDGEDYPYFVQEGFSKDFLRTENTLLERGKDGGVCRDKDGNVSLECTCGLILSGKTDPSNPLFTKGGSAWTNDSFPVLDIPSDEDPRHNPRNNCIHQGYASIALIPMRKKDRIMGLIQLNDKRKGRFTLATIEILEGIAAHIGEALMYKRARNDLKDSESRFKIIFNEAPVSNIIHDKDTGEIIDGNNESYTRYGFKNLNELKKNNFWMEPPYSKDDALKHIQKAATEGVQRFEWKNRKVTGEIFWEYVTLRLILINGIERILVTCVDITELKDAEDALRQKEDVLAHAQEISHTGSWELDVANNRLTWSDEVYRIFGCKPQEFAPTYEAFLDFIHPDDRAAVDEKYSRSVREGDAGYEIDHRIVRRTSGEVRYVHERCVHKCDDAGDVIQSTGMVQDITERKEMEKKLRLNQFALENAPVEIFLITPEGEIEHANKKACEKLNYHYDELVGKSVFDVDPNYPVSKRKDYWHQLQNGKVNIMETRHKTKEGEIYPAQVISKHLNFENKECEFAFAQDITDRKQAEKEKEELQNQLLQSQKMEAIGNLTGGVAHDFNNIIATIKMTTQLLLEENLSDEVKKDLTEIDKSSDRAKNLTKQLLQFSRKDTALKDIINLNTVVKNTCKMLERTIPENIDIIYTLKDDLKQIEAAPSTIDQVIMNLAINARNAMPEGGKISIETQNVEITTNNLPTPEIEPGKYVKLTVRDNGEGMDEETKEQMFDPFFTTKKVGEGTGMGLSVVYGVVKNCEGDISVETVPGEGTSINIYLPAVKEEKIQKEKEKDKERKSKDSSGEGLGILVIEDEEEVKKVSSKVLKKMGFKIFGAETAKEAAAVFKENKENIDIVFADVILPDGNGIEVAKRLKKLKDNLRIITTSGYIADEITREDIAKEDFKFIEKPFSLDKIRQILTELSGKI